MSVLLSFREHGSCPRPTVVEVRAQYRETARESVELRCRRCNNEAYTDSIISSVYEVEH
jgi:hypothetical protein